EALGNAKNGILLTGTATGNTIGSTDADEANFFVSNGSYGISFAGVTGNLLFNGTFGAFSSVSRANSLGGGLIDGGATGNTIGANSGFQNDTTQAIRITGVGTSGNLVTGSDITFCNEGVRIDSGASGNTIDDNLISLNTVGVTINGSGTIANVL